VNQNNKLTPLPYQKTGIRTIEDFDGIILLADERGCGKTLQILWSLKRNPDWLPALIVTPAGVKYQWEYFALHQTERRASIC